MSLPVLRTRCTGRLHPRVVVLGESEMRAWSSSLSSSSTLFFCKWLDLGSILPVNCWSVEGSEMQWLSYHPSQTSLSCRCVCHPVNCRKKRGGDTNTMEVMLQSTQQRKRKRWLINCQRNWQRTKKDQICVELFSLSTVWSLDMKCDYRRWKGDQWVWQQPTMSPLLKPSMPSTATMPYKSTKRAPIKTGSMPCH